MQAQQLGSGFDTVETRETDIHENDIGTLAGADLDSFRSVFSFGHDVKLFVVAKDGFDAVTHDLVIIDQKYVNHSYAAAVSQESPCRPGSGQLNLIIVSLSLERFTVRDMPFRLA